MRAGNYRALARAIGDSKNPPSADELTEYRKAWRQPGALTATINWYRAILKRRFVAVPQQNIRLPVRMIWGRLDPYALPRLAEASKALCVNAELTFLSDATHWVAHDEPDRVNAILLDWLRN